MTARLRISRLQELERLRELPDVSWWNTSLTLAFLMRDVAFGTDGPTHPAATMKTPRRQI